MGTHDFSLKTALYRADPGALSCLTQAVATCHPASLEVWQTAVDVGVDYLLTITGQADIGCTALLASSGFGPGAASPDTTPLTANCAVQIDAAGTLLTCPGATYRVPSSVAGPEPGLSVATIESAQPPLSSTFVQRPPTQRPTSYPTGINAEVLAVTLGSAEQPVITLLLPRLYCPSIFYGISTVPAPTPGPCVVMFDASTGRVGPATGTAVEANATCPAWPTPHVTFVLDSPPTIGCKPNLPPVAGLQAGAVGWLVEGGGVPYFVLASGTEIHPPTVTSSTPHPTPTTAPTP